MTPYEDTLEDDIARAKKILAAGKMKEEDIDPLWPAEMRQRFIEQSGTINGEDIYPAYKLLESLVEAVERDRKAMQHIMQVLGPESVSQCDGCRYETNEAIKTLSFVGIEYRLSKAMPHNPETEQKRN